MNYSSYQSTQGSLNWKITKELRFPITELLYPLITYPPGPPPVLGCFTLPTSPSNPVPSGLHSKTSLPLSLNAPPLPASPKQAAHFPLWSIRSKSLHFFVAIHLHFPRRYLFHEFPYDSFGWWAQLCPQRGASILGSVRESDHWTWVSTAQTR